MTIPLVFSKLGEHAKLLAAVIVAYALSPIDLIPDLLPIIGYLDDLVLMPLGIAIAIKLIPRLGELVQPINNLNGQLAICWVRDVFLVNGGVNINRIF